MSGGTGIRRRLPVSSGTSTIPCSVPRAMVNTGTPSALASAAASIGWVRPWVLALSDSSSTTTGVSLPPACWPPGVGAGRPGRGSRPRTTRAAAASRRGPARSRRPWPLPPRRAGTRPPRRRLAGRWSAGSGSGRWRRTTRFRPGTCPELLDELGRGLLGGDEPGRAHVGGVHRPDTSMTRTIVAAPSGTRASAWGLARLITRAARASR